MHMAAITGMVDGRGEHGRSQQATADAAATLSLLKKAQNQLTSSINAHRMSSSRRTWSETGDARCRAFQQKRRATNAATRHANLAIARYLA